MRCLYICISELRGQLTRLEELVGHVPHCVIGEVMLEAIQEAKAEKLQLNQQFSLKLKEWDDEKVCCLS